jgi:hypothetical protein
MVGGFALSSAWGERAMHPVRLQRIRATFAQIEPCGPAFIARALEGIRSVVPDVDQLLQGYDASEVNGRAWCAFRKVVMGIGTFRSIENALVALGVQAGRRGFEPAHLFAARTQFLRTLGELLGEEWMPQVRRDWSLVLAGVSGAMLRGLLHESMAATQAA